MAILNDSGSLTEPIPSCQVIVLNPIKPEIDSQGKNEGGGGEEKAKEKKQKEKKIKEKEEKKEGIKRERFRL